MVKNKACECKVQLNHLNSMQLMLMEALADKRWDAAKHYLNVVKDAIKEAGECAGVDVKPALNTLEKTGEYIEMKEEGIRLTLRTLEDAFWETIFHVCE